MVIDVLGVLRQAGLDIMCVDPAAFRNILLCDCDGVAVFDDRRSAGDLSQGDLVPAGDVLCRCDSAAVDSDGIACVEIFQGNSYIIGRMNVDQFHDFLSFRSDLILLKLKIITRSCKRPRHLLCG